MEAYTSSLGLLTPPTNSLAHSLTLLLTYSLTHWSVSTMPRLKFVPRFRACFIDAYTYIVKDKIDKTMFASSTFQIKHFIALLII